jgi:hypothetical protein
MYDNAKKESVDKTDNYSTGTKKLETNPYGLSWKRKNKHMSWK